MRSLPALIGLLLLAAPSSAQEVKESTVSGTLVSRSATIPTGETSAELFTVPSGTTFIMTQACASPPYRGIIVLGSDPAVSIVGSELGVVPLISCEPFHPGIAFAADEQISCQLSQFTSPFDISCLMTGVLQPVRHHGPR
jgi:hypothetical protein